MTDQQQHTATVNRVAWSIQQRATAQGWKGKKGDGLAVETACGALAAAIAILGEDHPTVNALSMFAFMVGTRGMTYVHERAARHQPTPDSAEATARAMGAT